MIAPGLTESQILGGSMERHYAPHADEHNAHDARAGHVDHPDHAGHDAHAGHDPEVFRRQFWIVLLLTIPVVVWSRDVQAWLGYTAPVFPGSMLVPAVFGTIVFGYGGRVFLVGARGELRNRLPGMMTLISLGISVAFIASVAATIGVFDVDVWWELSTLITIMSLGHWLEMRAIAQAQGAVSALAELLPDTAERLTGNGTTTETVPIGQLRAGDLVLLRPGSRVPADGELIEGAAEVDESMMTGESRQVAKGAGDRVVAGTVVSGGSLRVRVTAVGEKTVLSGIMRMVVKAQASQSRAQVLADRAAALLFYVALAVGIVTLVTWSALGDPEGALVRTATVLIIACPHALGLAMPLVTAIATTLGARNGLLVKSRLALERARNVDVVIFDKTGTLTRGRPVLAGVIAAPGVETDEVLRLAASVENDSEHPLARAIVAGALQRSVEPMPASGFEGLAGRGARAAVEGRTVTVGGPRFVGELKLAIPAELAGQIADWQAQGKTALHVAADGRVLGALATEDEIRPESADAVAELHRLGIRVAMITGDSHVVADAVARRIGVDEVAAQVLPGEKADAVRRFQAGGRTVAMVGDGVNDAPALAQADVGIAIGAGTDVAMESAGIVLVRDDPRDVVGAIRLSRASYRKMVENLGWATGYNVLALPVAAGVLAPIGFTLPMSLGAVVMSLSTIIVAANAQLLRGLQLRPGVAGSHRSP